MERRTYLTIAMVVLFAILAYQIAQTGSPETGRIARLARIRKMMDEGRPVYSAEEEIKKARFEQRAQRLAGLVETLAAPVAKIAESKPLAKKDEKKKPPGKKVAKKDKKKKHKVIGGTVSTDVAKNDQKKSDSNTESGSDMTGGYGGAGPQQEETHGRETVEYWMEYLSTGDYDRVSEFIEAYQTSTIKPEVFYTVVGFLLQDDRDVMHDHASRALASTPSTKSFNMLFAIETDTKESAHVRKQAREYLNMYSSVEYVRYLSSVLTQTGNEAASLRALALLNDSLQLVKKQVQVEQTGGDPKNPRTPASNPARYFTPFVSTLDRLVKSGGTVGQAASSTLDLLKQILPT